MAASPAPGTPQLPPAKIELPDDDGKGNSVGTRVVDQAYTFNDYDQIGEGTYGKVFVGTDKAGGKKVALKMIRMDTEKEGFPITAIREIKILSSLHHENIVNLREIVRSKVNRESNYKGAIYMVFDYAEHDLTGLLESLKYKLTPPQAKCILQQLLRGLTYCHINGILHRDLKASNLLIDAQGCLKIADFGLARPFQSQQDGKLTNRVITLWYRPPELLMGSEKYGPEVDMWSVGCILAELLAGRPIFPGKDEPDQLHCIFMMMGQPTEASWPGVSSLDFFKNMRPGAYPADDRKFQAWCKFHRLDPFAIDLLKKLLSMNPKERLRATDALNHKWFDGACKPADLPKVQDSHEWTVKHKRKHPEGRAQQPPQGAQQQNDRNVRQRQGAYPGGQQGAYPGAPQGHPAQRAGYTGAPAPQAYPGQVAHAAPTHGQVPHAGGRAPVFASALPGMAQPGYPPQQHAPGYGGGYGSASRAAAAPMYAGQQPQQMQHGVPRAGYGGQGRGVQVGYAGPGQLPPGQLPPQQQQQRGAPQHRGAPAQQQPGYYPQR